MSNQAVRRGGTERAAAAAADELPLAEAKLAPPRRRPGLVERPDILRALDDARDAALMLIAAPPGYGKTTAVCEWCATRRTPYVWVTLDEGDSDPVRFWTYVATSLDRLRGGLGRRALQRLRVPGASIETPVDEVMNGAAAYGDDVVIVLDDLHAVRGEETIESIVYAIARLPANAHLIVLTRTDPPLGLAGLRARGSLVELRAGDLAFTLAEAHTLLVDRAGLELDADEVAALHERTEGWPAALSVAAIWLRNVRDSRAAIAAFGGDHRFVADYLLGEVFAVLDEPTRDFLMEASVLGRFTPELCDAVLDRSDSASVLAEIERTNLFVARLAQSRWYRIHALFAAFAGFQLAARRPDAAHEIHRRAAEWLRDRDEPVEAVQHAAAAGDHRLVAEILHQYHLRLLRSGASATLLRWVRTLPDDELVALPELAVAAATATTLVGNDLERRRFLAVASRSAVERPDLSTPYLQAVEAMVRAGAVDDGVRDAVTQGRRAVAIARADSDEALVASLACCARALFFAGELEDAWALALEAVEHPDTDRRIPGQVVARTTLALVGVDLGRLTTARTHAEHAKSLVGELRSSRSWLGANACLALGSVLAAEEDLAGAERELVQAERLFRGEVATIYGAWALVLLADVRCRRGRLDEAETTLRAARAAFDELGDTGRLCSLADDVARDLELGRSRAERGELLDRPTDAELAVLRLLTTDLSVREIAGILFISPNTVRSHTRSLYRKLAVNSRTDAIARAGALGLLEEAESPM